MPETKYRGRRAFAIENSLLRVTVLVEGGHVCEILHQKSGVSPLWIPPWTSIEPSSYDPSRHPEYGSDSESKLLAGIMGHNLCLDIFGGPSEEEAKAGLTVHGEASVAPYQISGGNSGLTMRAELPQAQLRIEREIRLAPSSPVVDFHESVENLTATDRPIAWTQHVTLGPPFLERGSTEFRAPATRSKVFEEDFTEGKGHLKIGADFDWPLVPRKDGASSDLRVYTSAPASEWFTTHLMDPHREHAYFIAFSPRQKLAFGYVWRRSDFPWLGRWEENHSRVQPPWNGKTLTCGMEFGVSPMPETRRKMIERGTLFGMPAFRWLPARTRLRANYRAAFTAAQRIPETLTWGEPDGVRFED
jgi:hypothetical protein